VIRGAVYRVDLGDARRGHEQRGKRYGVVVSQSDMEWSVVTVVPTSTRAGRTVFRPEIDFGGEPTRALADQMRTIDTRYVGDLVGYLGVAQLRSIDLALANYLGSARLPG
jgi:mRNA interferase MazF